ncbi:rhodanese-like domain-containing protein [Sulfurospirillum arcachonense]|uniref:rhodanese-like domain-containing protein n=1 Tax=Sulfurospirillum arcachonense TaxID=57666 RepID=UPI00046976BD|nr:rhodanese-like domain-containing protein [Sulfurospirillum arcachonense]
MRYKLLGALAVSAALLFTGCVETKPTTPAQKSMSKPSAKVAGLIKKFNLKVVNYEYTKKAIGNGTRKGAKALLIDARPAKKYASSTIPSSINIPDTAFDKYVGQLDKVAKDKEIIVYCGGWNCGKSPKVAGMLKKKGFKNVKLYQAGEPEWKKMTYVEVGTPVVAAAYKKGSAVLIDARPYKKYLGATIPSAVSIPDTAMDKLAGRFPADKTTPIITFCGGYNCHKSHAVADKLLSLGYTNVKVYAGGVPVWKKEGMATTGGSKAKKAPAKVAPKASKMVSGIKLGEDDGTVDGEWFKANMKSLSHVQIVDVRSPSEFKVGHLPGAINIEAEKLNAVAFYAKLPKNKTIVINCASGGRAMEAWMKLNDAKMDVSKIFYFDANIDCQGTKCKIEVNEPLG